MKSDFELQEQPNDQRDSSVMYLLRMPVTPHVGYVGLTVAALPKVRDSDTRLNQGKQRRAGLP